MDWAINLKDPMDRKVGSPQMETRPCPQPTTHLGRLPLGHCWFHALFSHQSHPRVARWCPSHSLRVSSGRADKEQEAKWLWTHLQSADEPGAVAAWGWVLFAEKAGEVWAFEGMMTAVEWQPSGFMVMPVVWVLCRLLPPPIPNCIFWVYWKDSFYFSC